MQPRSCASKIEEIPNGWKDDRRVSRGTRPLLCLIRIGADGLAADLAARRRAPAIRRRRLPARDRAVLLSAQLALRQRTPDDELITMGVGWGRWICPPPIHRPL